MTQVLALATDAVVMAVPAVTAAMVILCLRGRNGGPEQNPTSDEREKNAFHDEELLLRWSVSCSNVCAWEAPRSRKVAARESANVHEHLVTLYAQRKDIHPAAIRRLRRAGLNIKSP